MIDLPPPPQETIPTYHEEQVIYLEKPSPMETYIQLTGYSTPSISYDSVALYNDLPVSAEDERKIHELIKILATHNYLSLFAKYNSKLHKTEKEIYHVHPLKFLEILHNNTSSKKYLRKVLSDSLLKKNFIGGFSEKMERDFQHNNFARFIEDFTRSTQLNKSHIESMISRKRWGELVEYVSKN